MRTLQEVLGLSVVTDRHLTRAQPAGVQDEEVPLLLVDERHGDGDRAKPHDVALRRNGAHYDTCLVLDEDVFVVTNHHRELRCRGFASTGSGPPSVLDAEEVADVVDGGTGETESEDGRVGVLLGACVNTNHPFEM